MSLYRQLPNRQRVYLENINNEHVILRAYVDSDNSLVVIYTNKHNPQDSFAYNYNASNTRDWISAYRIINSYKSIIQERNYVEEASALY